MMDPTATVRFSVGVVPDAVVTVPGITGLGLAEEDQSNVYHLPGVTVSSYPDPLSLTLLSKSAQLLQRDLLVVLYIVV